LSSAPARPLGGRVAIVTGAATGIGKAIATRLASDGAAVAANHLPAQTEEAAALVGAIEDSGGTAVALAADISSREHFTHLLPCVRALASLSMCSWLATRPWQPS